MAFFIGNLTTVIYTVLGAYFMYTLMFKGQLSETFVKHAGTADYMTYVIVGSLAYTLVVKTLLNVSRSLITELREGTLESLLIAPFSRLGYFSGTMLHHTVMAMGEMAFSIAICALFGLNISNINIATFLIGLVLSLYCYFGLSMCLGAVMLYTRDTYISQNTLFMIIFLVCGVVFPVEYLPSGLRVFSEILPVSDAINVLRASVISGVGASALSGTYLKMFVMGSVYFTVGYKSIRRIENIALEKIFG